MKKLLALILALLMLCGCSSEPEEIERELNGEPARGIIERGILVERTKDYSGKIETEVFPEDNTPIGEKKAYNAVYYNKAFGIRIGEKSPIGFDNDIILGYMGDCEIFANGSIDPNNAEFFDVCSDGGKGFGSIEIRYENMPEFRGKVLSEKEYAEIALEEFAENLADGYSYGEEKQTFTVLEKEIDTQKVDGETLYCLKYHVSLDGYNNVKIYYGIILRRTGDWMTNIIVSYNFTPGIDYAAKYITFDN